MRLCGPLALRDRVDFTCFQGGSEMAAIVRGVAAELGALANTSHAGGRALRRAGAGCVLLAAAHRAGADGAQSFARGAAAQRDRNDQDYGTTGGIPPWSSASSCPDLH